MHILHITYSVDMCPALDHEIFKIMDGSHCDLDLMRDDAIRDIFFYYENSTQLESAEQLLLEQGSKVLEGLEDRDICILNLIKYFKYQKTKFQDEKLLLRKRINELYIKHKLREPDNGKESSKQEKRGRPKKQATKLKESPVDAKEEAQETGLNDGDDKQPS